jgi:hypothetical protein
VNSSLEIPAWRTLLGRAADKQALSFDDPLTALVPIWVAALIVVATTTVLLSYQMHRSETPSLRLGLAGDLGIIAGLVTVGVLGVTYFANTSFDPDWYATLLFWTGSWVAMIIGAVLGSLASIHSYKRSKSAPDTESQSGAVSND